MAQQVVPFGASFFRAADVSKADLGSSLETRTEKMDDKKMFPTLIGQQNQHKPLNKVARKGFLGSCVSLITLEETYLRSKNLSG